MKHYLVRCTFDKRIIGKYSMPYTIEITSKDFLKYKLDVFPNVHKYFENRKYLYLDMPDNLQGKLIKRKQVIDYMHFSPFCLSLLAVVSNKMKQILEELNVSKDEYVLKRISIKGYSEEFYLLFVPLISDSEFIYPKCIFREAFGDKKIVIFNNREEYHNAHNYYDLPKITLKDKYKNYDLLNPLASGCFLSDRLINAMREENIVGFEIVEGGCFYQELYFSYD